VWSAEAESQPKLISVHFGLKIWHLVATVLIIFLRINCPNFTLGVRSRSFNDVTVSRYVKWFWLLLLSCVTVCVSCHCCPACCIPCVRLSDLS